MAPSPETHNQPNYALREEAARHEILSPAAVRQPNKNADGLMTNEGIVGTVGCIGKFELHALAAVDTWVEVG